MTPTITIPESMLRDVLDVATASMDFASGFLTTEQTDSLRAVADLLGIDPLVVTPANHVCHYTGRHRWSKLVNGAFGGADGEWWCVHCHTTTKTPAATDVIGRPQRDSRDPLPERYSPAAVPFDDGLPPMPIQGPPKP